MDKMAAMKQLEAYGTEQNRKIYARHGGGGAMFGVSFANLGKLKKEIRTDTELARELWATGNHDARVLATMIADPSRMDSKTLESWAKDLDSYVLTDAFSKLAAQAPPAKKLMQKWTRSTGEWTGTAGWTILAILSTEPSELEEQELERFLETIEERIHQSKNRTRHAMNLALISLAARSPAVREKALAAAARIGPVEVDHGDTGCKTPDAIAYIKKMAERKTRTAGGRAKATKLNAPANAPSAKARRGGTQTRRR